MHLAIHPSRLLTQEARSLLTRLDRVKPFALQMTSVLAAAVSPGAQTAIETYMAGCRRQLRKTVIEFLRWLGGEGAKASPVEAQRRFTILRIRFNTVLSHFDIYSDVLVQRSEHEFGVWLGGLDIVAADALELPGYYEVPPVVCYLDRGHGAAIRRARTRLPGGGENPVAVIRIPRERMVGSGIASSLVHEVGHQVAALLDLVNSLRPVLKGMQMKRGPEQAAWRIWERCISEIVADFWAVAKVGIAATTGLIGVVSLPRAFVFRIALDDPHPFPWIRVKLSCAMGDALFPHPQWQQMARLWESFYPTADLEDDRKQIIQLLESTLPSFISLIVNHRPKALRGASVVEALNVNERQPARLAALFERWKRFPREMRSAPPTLCFAVLGQARLDGHLDPEAESRWLADLLTYWALRGTLDMSALCASQAQAHISAPKI
ncbi:MAG: hypothetical protein H0X66_12730 [Verrucomicrobia bacterium]|nr:hypothetical protein [Verrucomicrobiota bacterium]